MPYEKAWVFEKDEMLIELVQYYPALYDQQSQHYSDSLHKKNIWAEIERVLEVPGPKPRWEQLRSQYRKYLSKYKTGEPPAKIVKWRFADQMKFLNSYTYTNGPQKTSSNLNNESDYEDSGSVERALEHFVKTENIDNDTCSVGEGSESIQNFENRTVSVGEGSESFQNNENRTLSVSKRKSQNTPVSIENASSTLTLMKYILQKREEEEQSVHPLDKFFSLMASTVKNFSPIDQHYVKTQVFTLVSQMEEKYLDASPSSTSLPGIPIRKSSISSDPLAPASP